MAPVITIKPEAKTPAEPETATPSPASAPSRVARAASVAAVAAAALAVAIGGFVAGRNHAAQDGSTSRRAATPTLKPVANGGYVRWQTDAVDVVVDKTFSDLGGDDLFGSVVDAW